MPKSAIAAGVDVLLIEVHPNPKVSLSDGAQTLKLKDFSKLMMELNAVAHAVDREINLTGNVA
ncbi:2-dehydro-3-deoxyphosphooctonate aldolase [subsurface metagenome]